MAINVRLAPSFAVQVEHTAAKMVEENMDVCPIPRGLGMVLVRTGSIEYQHRLDTEPLVIMIPKVVSMGRHGFIVCEC